MATVEPLYSQDEEQKGLKLHHFNTLDGKKLTEEPEIIKNSLAEYFANHYEQDISYSIGVIEQGVTNLDDLTKHTGQSLQFSSGDRFFFSNKEDIRDQIFPKASDGAAYGSNVFTECNKFHKVSGATILIVDDKEIDPETGEISGENGGEIPIEIAKKLVQDCYGKIDKALHHQLGNDLDW